MHDVVIQPVAPVGLGGGKESIPNIAAAPSRIVKKASDLSKLTYIFDEGVPKNGTYNIILANRLADDRVSYEIDVVQQSRISPVESWFEVAVAKSSRTAGGQTIILIHPRDEHGNAILSKDLVQDGFKVQYAKAKHGLGFTAGKNIKYGDVDFYRTLDPEACTLGPEDAGIISCEVRLTLLGQY